jgi:deoxycytidylate deaminase
MDDLQTQTYYMGIAIAVREKVNCTGNRVGAVLVLESRVIFYWVER